MFSILIKKHFLKDLLEGFVDIHNHILPGIDDGATSLAESVSLIKGMRALGVKQFIATPHIMADFYPNDEITIGNAFQNVITELAKKKLNNILVNPSAEYMMDNHFEALIDKNNIFPLKENYVLVEMSYFQPPINLEEILNKLVMKNFIPVLAHPERYSFYHNRKKTYRALKKMGCFFQLNILSLGDHYGKNVQKVGMHLLEENLIDFIASDVHNESHIKKLNDLILTKSQKLILPKIIENTKSTFLVS